MATYKLPNNGQWRQLGYGDRAGELWQTKNMDGRTSPGKLKLARPFKQVATAATLGNNVVVGFAMYGGYAYAITDESVLRAQSPYTSWSSVSTTPTNAQDMVVFKDRLVITTTDNLDAYNGTLYSQDWWTARGNPTLQSHNPPTTIVPHILEVIRIGSETLAVTDGNMVHAYTGDITSGSGTSVTVDIDGQFTACCLKSSIRRVWIGTYTETGEQAYVYEWDGASTNYVQGYPVGAKAVLAMELVDNAPLIVTERGEIKLFNNAGFTTVARFPFALNPVFSDGVETGLIQDTNTSRPIHPKGIKREGNTVYIMTAWKKINDDVPIDERTPAGLWALDLTTYSLTHLGSPANENVFNASSPVMVINDPNTRLFVATKRNIAADEEGIWVEDLSDTSTNTGHFTTVELPAEAVLDVWDRVYTQARLGASNEIVVKYRAVRKATYPITIENVAWASTTQFNTTLDLSDVEIGDEVEILSGANVGQSTHITKIEHSATVYAVTVEDALGDGTTDIRIDNFKKIPKTYTEGDLKSLGIGQSGTMCQLRFWVSGRAGFPEIGGVLLHSNPKQNV